MYLKYLLIVSPVLYNLTQTVEVEKSHEHNTNLISWNFLKSKLIIPAHEFYEDVPVVRGVKLERSFVKQKRRPIVAAGVTRK